MKLPILSIRDTLIGFGSTFTAVNEDVAIRGFTNSIVRSLESDVDDATAPEDLVLYCLGEFDTDDGTISPCEPRAISRGSAVVLQYRNNFKHNIDNTGGDSLDDL